MLGTEADLPAVDSSGQLPRQLVFFMPSQPRQLHQGKNSFRKKPEEVTLKKKGEREGTPTTLCGHLPVCFVVLLSTSRGDIKREEECGRDGHRLTFTCLFRGVANARCRSSWRRQC